MQKTTKKLLTLRSTGPTRVGRRRKDGPWWRAGPSNNGKRERSRGGEQANECGGAYFNFKDKKEGERIEMDVKNSSIFSSSKGLVTTTEMEHYPEKSKFRAMHTGHQGHV